MGNMYNKIKKRPVKKKFSRASPKSGVTQDDICSEQIPSGSAYREPLMITRRRLSLDVEQLQLLLGTHPAICKLINCDAAGDDETDDDSTDVPFRVGFSPDEVVLEWYTPLPPFPATPRTATLAQIREQRRQRALFDEADAEDT